MITDLAYHAQKISLLLLADIMSFKELCYSQNTKDLSDYQAQRALFTMFQGFDVVGMMCIFISCINLHKTFKGSS